MAAAAASGRVSSNDSLSDIKHLINETLKPLRERLQPSIDLATNWRSNCELFSEFQLELALINKRIEAWQPLLSEQRIKTVWQRTYPMMNNPNPEHDQLDSFQANLVRFGAYVKAEEPEFKAKQIMRFGNDEIGKYELPVNLEYLDEPERMRVQLVCRENIPQLHERIKDWAFDVPEWQLIKACIRRVNDEISSDQDVYNQDAVIANLFRALNLMGLIDKRK